VFHTPGWLEALKRTYGYEPVAYTTTPPDTALTDGVAFCRVDSWITGRRLLSLPFSDHCEPLVDRLEDLEAILDTLKLDSPRGGWKYVEIRPRTTYAGPPAALAPSQTFHFHSLDLTPTLEEIFRRFHKDSIQRKIRRAEREELTYEEGRGEALLAKFYQLLLRTRQRHHLPPHPLVWFRNLTECLGESLKIRVASKGGQPIASVLTLAFKDVVVYKYGCSDERFHNLGGMQLLFWNSIRDGKMTGAREFDLGRSDSDNSGLVTFKDRWGAARSQLTYWRYPARSASPGASDWRMQVAKKIFARMPDRLLTAAGRMLYQHIG
jgi:hypothetical protein